MSVRSVARVKSSPLLKGSWRGIGAARSLFGGKERPRASQSKVLSGEDGPLYTVESKSSIIGCIVQVIMVLSFLCKHWLFNIQILMTVLDCNKYPNLNSEQLNLKKANFFCK